MDKAIKPEEIEKLKAEGNAAFGKSDYTRAILYYKQGLSLTEKYNSQNEGSLPFKREIGESPALESNQMYH